MTKTLVVNLLGGPNTGKTTTGLGIAAELGFRGYRIEFLPEFVKGAVWGERNDVLTDQRYIFAKQNNLLKRLIGKVYVVINDGSLIHSCAYVSGNEFKSFEKDVVQVFLQYNNYNIYFNRRFDIPFDPVGRYQKSHAEGLKTDSKVLKILKKNNISYKIIQTEQSLVSEIADIIEAKIIELNPCLVQEKNSVMLNS